MSDLLHFMCWFACVFISAICVAGLTGDYWHSQSVAMSLLLPLCLSLTLGSFLFLGCWSLRAGWRSHASFMQSDSIAQVSQTSSAATRNENLGSSRCILD